MTLPGEDESIPPTRGEGMLFLPSHILPLSPLPSLYLLSVQDSARPSRLFPSNRLMVSQQPELPEVLGPAERSGFSLSQEESRDTNSDKALLPTWL